LNPHGFFFCGDICTSRSMPLQSMLKRNCGFEFITALAKSRKHRANWNACEFLFLTELSCRGHLECFLYESKDNEVISSCLSSSCTQPVTLRKYWRCDNGSWNEKSCNFLSKALREQICMNVFTYLMPRNHHGKYRM
jgi:hypothetical protein